ncbi:SOS response-associated peptidase [Billgrantia bachuensis]|uniref:Abasic site processing protein n=1 Tax=Billgrantia bachuensis TaxID=2717286 RepID=A0ABX0PT52_9GAMM|nr:SOS response-associated peptidase [Halomonas bachuensis]NIC05277.1 SOS response-associated peptidase [Halomonas bachuensis]
MCGRFALYSPYPKIAARLGLPVLEDQLEPRYNVPPGVWISAARHPGGDEPLALDYVWWGYKPKWAGEKAPTPINASAEKVATSGYYKQAFSRGRCLIPANGWYEWDKSVKPRQPYFICRQDRELLWMAAIWAERADGRPGCAIITEPSRGATQAIHDRMPLLLDDASLEPWLDPDLTDRETIRNVVRHIDAELIEHWPVSRAVNTSSEDLGAELINPA